MPVTNLPLADLITRPPMRQRVVEDCVALVDEEVRSKSGLGGVAIKGAYGTVKKLKPRFVPDVIEALLDRDVRDRSFFEDQAAMSTLSAVELARIIQQGNDQVPAFGATLSEEEVWAVAAYLRTLSFDTTSIAAAPEANRTPSRGLAKRLVARVSA